MKHFTNLVLVIVLIVLVACLIVGAAVYWWQSSANQSDLAEKDNQIASLKNIIQDTSKWEECGVCEECEECEECASNEPIVIFTPSGLFTDEEKTELYDKVINPYIDYQANTDYPVLTMDIQKSDLVDYSYEIDVIMATGVNSGFLYGTPGQKLEYYLPTCMGPCPFTDEFKEKYPEIVAKDEQLNNITP